MRDYSYQEAEIIVKEMMDQLCLDMTAQKLATESVTLQVGYSYTFKVPDTKGTAHIAAPTCSAAMIVPAVATLYRRIVNKSYGIRRITLSCNSVIENKEVLQLNVFEDSKRQIRNEALQEAILGIKAKYGKNAILKGTNYFDAATGKERNMQIGGHKANGI